jgi:hypothetical protein
MSSGISLLAKSNKRQHSVLRTTTYEIKKILILCVYFSHIKFQQYAKRLMGCVTFAALRKAVF